MSRRLLALLPALAVVFVLVGSSLHAVDARDSRDARDAPGVSLALAAEPQRWRPRLGATFNNPVSGPVQREAILDKIRRAIDHTPRGETIRFAMYSFNRKEIASALIRAHARGVKVQVLLNDNWVSEPARRLMRRLGRNVRRPSFIRLCEGSCRGGPGNLHVKVYAFTRSGTARHVVMTGSSNLTYRAVHLQWEDLYTLYHQGLHDTFVKVFNQMKHDRRFRPRWVEYSDAEVEAQFQRTRSGSEAEEATVKVTAARIVPPDQDPILQRLRKITCRAQRGFGVNGHTTIRIMMFGWNSERGQYLAERVAYMQRRGCDIRVIVSAPGRAVVRTLRESGVRVRSADWQYLPILGEFNMIQHLKVMTVNGTYGGRNTRSVWTGSENWSTMSLRNDEITIRVDGPVYWDYINRFKTLWARGTHAVGLHPTYKPEW